MRTKEKGFAILELAVVLALLTLIGSVGYIYFLAPTRAPSIIQSSKEIPVVEKKETIPPPSSLVEKLLVSPPTPAPPTFEQKPSPPPPTPPSTIKPPAPPIPPPSPLPLPAKPPSPPPSPSLKPLPLEQMTRDIIPKDFYCFYINANKDRSECKRYYTSAGLLICPQYFNPVYTQDGTFYPSACWAEVFGTKEYFYGYSPALLRLFREQWAKEGLTVPYPDIEFTYNGSGLSDFKSGTWLRSSVWHDTRHYSVIDYNIATNQGNNAFTQKLTYTTVTPVINNSLRTLLVYVTFDNAYPDSLLVQLSSTYGSLLNSYMRKKQNVSNPLQYLFSPVIIPPPAITSAPPQEGVPGPAGGGENEKVRPITPTHFIFEETELRAIYSAAVEKTGAQNFDATAVIPLQINGFGGYYANWQTPQGKELQLIVAPLTPPANYSIVDKKKGLDGIAAFQKMFGTLSHEILHAVGLPGDHMPMEYGNFLNWTGGLITDLVTGKSTPQSKTACDFIGTSPDYYSVELPTDLRIKVGAELPGLWPEKSKSGDCLTGLYNNEILKDMDKDGEYEFIYRNNLIALPLQRFLGWIDVDGDGVTELIDPTPYGRQ